MFSVTKYYFINTFVLFLFDMKQLSSPNHLYVIDVCSLVFRDLCQRWCVCVTFILKSPVTS